MKPPAIHRGHPLSGPASNTLGPPARAGRARVLRQTLALAAAVAFLGCASRREVGAGLREYGPFYPVAAASDLAKTGTRNLWRIRHSFDRPPPPPESIPADVLRALESGGGMLLPSRASRPHAPGFGASEQTHPPREQALLASVEEVTQRRFNWVLDVRLPDIAEARPHSIIVLNPRLLASASSAQQLFVVLHEAGHQLRGHLVATNLPRSVMEIEADLFAAEMLLKLGFEPYEVFWVASLAFPDKPPRADYPEAVERIKRIRGFLQLQNPG